METEGVPGPCWRPAASLAPFLRCCCGSERNLGPGNMPGGNGGSCLGFVSFSFFSFGPFRNRAKFSLSSLWD